jgi:Domain of unknown function (DUF4157)
MRSGREAAVPDEVIAALEHVLGTRVGHVKVIEHSWFARLHVRAVATTRPRRIYLRGGAGEFFANPWLMLHEYCHVVHQWQPGRLTVPRYLFECLQRGYWNNRFEVEAREFADLNVARLHAMLTLLAPPAPALTPLESSSTASQPNSASRR